MPRSQILNNFLEEKPKKITVEKAVMLLDQLSCEVDKRAPRYMRLFENTLIEEGFCSFQLLNALCKKGCRHFSNLTINLSPSTPEGLNSNNLTCGVAPIDDVQFEACSVIPDDNYTLLISLSHLAIPGIEVPKISISAENFSNLESAIHCENLLSWLSVHRAVLHDNQKNERDLKLERLYCESDDLKKISSEIFCALIFNKNNKIKHKAIKNFTVKNCWDISSLLQNEKRPEVIYQFIDALLALDFFDCQFSDGIKLPDVILNQCENKSVATKMLAENNASVINLKTILTEAKRALEKAVSINPSFKLKLTAAEFEADIKSGRTYFRGCSIQGAATLSAIKKNKIGVDCNNATFNGDLVMGVMTKTTLCNVKIQRIIITSETDFRGYKSDMNFSDDTLITYQYRIKNENHEFTTSIKELYDDLEKEYYQRRGTSFFDKNFRSDYFKKLQKKYDSGCKGQKLFDALSYMQEKRSIFSRKKNSRTYKAFNKIVTDFHQEKLTREKCTQEKQKKPSDTNNVEMQHDVKNSVNASCDAKASKVVALEFYFMANGALNCEKILSQPSSFKVAFFAHKAELFEGRLDEENAPAKELEGVVKKAIENSCALLDRVLSCFDSVDLLGNELTDTHDRDLHENEVIASYSFLKMTGGDAAVKKYDEFLQKNIYPRYLKYVVYDEKYFDGVLQKKLRYDLIEKLFVTSGVIEKSELLSRLSDKRKQVNGGAALFCCPPEFHKECQIRWAELPLTVLEDIGCINSILVSEIMALIKEKHPEIIGVKLTQLQRQYYISILIQQGNFQEAQVEIHAFNAAWPEQENSRITVDPCEKSHSVLITAKKEMLAEVLNTAQESGPKYLEFEKLFEFIKKQKKGVNLEIALAQLSRLKSAIENGVELTRVVKKIVNKKLLANPPQPVDAALLIALKNCIYKPCVWAGSVESQQKLSADLTAFMRKKSNFSAENTLVLQAASQILKVMTPLSTINSEVDNCTQFALPTFREFSAAVYQTNTVISLLKTALQGLFNYHAIAKEKLFVDDKLQDITADLENEIKRLSIKTIDLAHDLSKYPVLIKFLEDKGISDPTKNYLKYLQLLLLQDVLKKQTQEIAKGESISSCEAVFDHVALILTEIKQILVNKNNAHATSYYAQWSGAKSFSDCVDEALLAVSVAKQTWSSGLVSTYVVAPEYSSRELLLNASLSL